MSNKGFSLAIALLIAGGASFSPVSVIAQETNAAPKKAVSDGEVDESTSEANYASIGNGTINDANVNVRARASFLGEVLVKLQKGDTVTILEEITRKSPAKGEPTNWFRIALPDNTPVWVFSDYIDPQSKTVKATRLNFRGGAGENYSILGRLKKGDTVKWISEKDNWTQIEAPANAFAFVAADFVEKQSGTVATPAPEAAPAPAPAPVAEAAPAPEVPAPAPEVVTLPEEPAAPAQPAAAEPAPAVAIAEPAPAILPGEPAAPEVQSPPPAAPEVLVKRVVKREGIVRRAHNIQSPTYFELESIDSGKVVNYLHSPETMKVIEHGKKAVAVPDMDLVPYVGRRVIVTGEEFMDKRWKRTPVVNVEAIDLQQ